MVAAAALRLHINMVTLSCRQSQLLSSPPTAIASQTTTYSRLILVVDIEAKQKLLSCHKQAGNLKGVLEVAPAAACLRLRRLTHARGFLFASVVPTTTIA